MATLKSPANSSAAGRFRLDHVAFGLARVEDSAAVLAGELGGRPFVGGPGIGFSGIQWQFARGELIEVIQPEGDPTGFLYRFLERRGPGLHHVTFKVDDIEWAAARAREFGYEVVGLRTDNPGWKELFLHPRQAGGIVVQIAESHPELDVAPWTPDWPFPAAERKAPAAAEIRHLRLAVAERAAAERQWGVFLSGRAREQDGTIVFSWPDSPIGIRIVVTREAPQGPLGLEVRAPWAGRQGTAASALGTQLIWID